MFKCHLIHFKGECEQFKGVFNSVTEKQGKVLGSWSSGSFITYFINLIILAFIIAPILGISMHVFILCVDLAICQKGFTLKRDENIKVHYNVYKKSLCRYVQ